MQLNHIVNLAKLHNYGILRRRHVQHTYCYCFGHFWTEPHGHHACLFLSSVLKRTTHSQCQPIYDAT